MSNHHWDSPKFQKPGGMAWLEEDHAIAVAITTGRENMSYLRVSETDRGTLLSAPIQKSEWLLRRLKGRKVA